MLKSIIIITLMSQNLLRINPYCDQFFIVALQNLRRILTTQPIDSIEIEFKYAEFTYFSPIYNEQDFRDLNRQTSQRVEMLYNAHYQLFLNSLHMLSKQNILFLNPLGRNTYCLRSGINEPVHKKFYHIRDLLVKLCETNLLAPNRKIYNIEPPINIYSEMSMNNNNHLMTVTQNNEMRVDIYIKQGAPEQLRGRYSYSNRSGWMKTNKIPLCTQMDYMLNERTFRFAINKQVQKEVGQTEINAIANVLTKPRAIDIRMKRMLRVRKGDVYELALSQIYNIVDLGKISELPQRLLDDNKEELDIYLNKVFINFYSEKQKQHTKYQIQCEFTKQHTRELKKLITQNKLHQVKVEVESAIDQLYVLYYADHSTKVMEVPWLNRRVSSLAETRLQNEYGNYMREQLYQQMKKQL